MTEAEVSELEIRIENMPLAEKLAWRQKVLDAIQATIAKHQAEAESALEYGSSDDEYAARIRALTAASFYEKARYGANWKNWLYLVEIDNAH